MGSSKKLTAFILSLTMIMFQHAGSASLNEDNCRCRSVDQTWCCAFGCSAYNNPGCNSTTVDLLSPAFIFTDQSTFNVYYGCNCPGYTYNNGTDVGDNGLVIAGTAVTMYRYTKCSGFAHGDDDTIAACCAYCCGPDPITTTTTPRPNSDD